MRYNLNSGYGQMLAAQIAKAVGTVFGKVFVVIPAGDTATKGRLAELLTPDPDGAVRIFTTVKAAYDATTTNGDDVVLLSTYSNHELSEMLTISKSRVHFVGDQFGRKYGQRAKINYADGIATADPFAVKNTGVGNTFTGIKFLNNNTDAQVVSTFGEGGEYTVFRNCEFYNSTNLDSDTVSEFVSNGDSTQFYDCTFGSLADAVSGDKVRPAVLFTKETVGTGLVSRDIYFDRCSFWKQAGGTTTAMVKIAADADIERYCEFHDCAFVANILGAVPAVAIASPTLTNATFVVSGDTYAIQCTKIATATGVFSALNAKVATATIGIQTT